MQITSNVTNPSFTAKLKNNEVTTNMINRMDKKQVNDFKQALVALDKTHKEDVLEIKSTGQYLSRKRGCGNNYDLVNTKNKSQNIRLNKDFRSVDLNDLINILKNVATPNTEEHDKMFGLKERQEVFDMLV